MDPLSQAFGALADPTRRDMLARMAAGEETVTSLAQQYGLSLQAASKHLKVLETAGIVTKSREAQRRPLHLEPGVLDLMAGWIRRYQREVEARYQRLDDVLAEMNGADAREETA